MGQDLFKEITRRVCSDASLENALHGTLLFLKSKIPLDMMFLAGYEARRSVQKDVRLIAAALEEGGYPLDDRIILPKESWTETQSWLDRCGKSPEPWFRDHTNAFLQKARDLLLEKPVSNEALASKMKTFSVLTSALEINGRVIGVLSFVAAGENRYTETHGELIEAVKEPFGIALYHALRYRKLEQHHQALQTDARLMKGDVIIGADSGLREVQQMIEDVAPTDSPVMLLGETGTGKEVVAGKIHKLSLRSRGPMVSLNCGAIPDSLVDSELFGHEKGAFTGALKTKPGRFERANRGTLFLDEIGELPLHAQVKLLRVLQTGTFERVGGIRTHYSDVRIVAATHQNMLELIEKGTFRSDLWYRLNVFPISIPPLKQRKQDIPALLEHFIGLKTREMSLSVRQTLAPGALEQLMAYDWPGNVREFQNIIERALIVGKGRPLSFPNLQPGESKTPAPVRQAAGKSLATLDDVVADHIRDVLHHTRGRISGRRGAAEILDMHPNTLRYRMNKLNIKC